ncbi:MAG TPA: helix-turn-helix domain-containing protein, partial [Blastocatellia bacterium]|nr:helix-turn-helix domain-containing protein [Blastocatellia bacterium]
MTPERSNPQVKIVKSLAESIVFPTIDDLLPAGQTLEAFLKQGHLAARRIKAGRAVCWRRGGAPGLALLLRGSVDIFYPARSYPLFAKRVVSNQVFGDLPPFCERSLGGEAVAVEDCQVVILGSQHARMLLGGWIQAVPVWYRESRERLIAWRRGSLRSLYATFKPPLPSLLIGLGGRKGVICGMTQSQIADMLGAHRGSVARALARLKQGGLIEVSRERIILLDIKGLLASIAAESD